MTFNRQRLSIFVVSMVIVCAALSDLNVPAARAQEYTSDGSVRPDPALSPDQTDPGPVLSPGAVRPDRALSPEETDPGPVLSPGAVRPDRALSPEATDPPPVLSPDAVRPDPARPPD